MKPNPIRPVISLFKRMGYVHFNVFVYNHIEHGYAWRRINEKAMSIMGLGAFLNIILDSLIMKLMGEICN